MSTAPADICLLLEGTYPFVSGGVSGWVHDLIRAHGSLRFHCLAIVADERKRRFAYELPANVSGLTVLPLNRLRAPERGPEDARLLNALAPALSGIERGAGLEAVAAASAAFAAATAPVSGWTLLDSRAAWRALEAAYRSAMPEASFLHYFWTQRSIRSAFFAAMTAPIPPARVYHTVSTGYAGLIGARARLETGRPLLVTEHGIYTNERRIEIALADWLHDPASQALGARPDAPSLRRIWSQTFLGYSRAAYDAADRILTLFKGNQDMQIADGAPRPRCTIVPNGIDPDAYARIAPAPGRPPTVALIGRVVPIKDVKSYLRAVKLALDRVADLHALVIGPTDEDADYAADCVALAGSLGIADRVHFTGRVAMGDWWPRIDVSVLSSLSEGQPLVVLEAGAAGIPTVATDVGACREMILGLPGESPAFGPGGAIVPPADAAALADAMVRFLADPGARARAGAAMRTRIAQRYDKRTIDAIYAGLYREALARPDDVVVRREAA